MGEASLANANPPFPPLLKGGLVGIFPVTANFEVTVITFENRHSFVIQRSGHGIEVVSKSPRKRESSYGELWGRV